MDSDFLKLLKDYLPEWIIALGVVAFICLFLFKGFRDAFSNIKWPRWFSKKRIRVEDLKHHQFFVFIDYMDKYKIDRMDFGCPARNRIFRDYFKFRCHTFHTNTQNLITEDVLKLSQLDIKTKIFNTLYSSIEDGNKLMIDQCNTDEERNVAKVVVERFSAHADHCIEALMEVIETIFDSGFTYESNLDRLNAILNVFLFTFVATFAESEKILHNINGEISGKQYKGLIIK